MSVIDRGLDSLTFLTDQARDALRRRLRELAGVALLVLSMLLAAALATWSVQDPSLSHATNAPVRNLLGVTGATVSDLVMQLLGLGSLALGLAPCGPPSACARAFPDRRMDCRDSACDGLCVEPPAQRHVAIAGRPRRG